LNFYFARYIFSGAEVYPEDLSASDSDDDDDDEDGDEEEEDQEDEGGEEEEEEESSELNTSQSVDLNTSDVSFIYR
jgi:hypothetical protein